MTLKKIFCMFLITPVTPVTQFNKYLLTDSYIITIKCFILVLAVLFLIITLDYIIDCSSFFDFELKEFSLIIGFSVFFMLFLVSSIDLFGMYVCLEGLSFSLYILAGMNAFSKSSTEASVKYFCLGALSSGLLLFGIANIFLMTGTLNFLELRCLFSNLESVHPLLAVSISLVFFGLFYKLSLFPCHG